MLVLTIILEETTNQVKFHGDMPLVLAQQLIQEIVIQERVKAELVRVQDGQEESQNARDTKEKTEKPAEAEG